MAQLVECFLITYAALGLASSHKLGVVAHAYNPVLFIPVLGRWRQKDQKVNGKFWAIPGLHEFLSRKRKKRKRKLVEILGSNTICRYGRNSKRKRRENGIECKRMKG